MKKIILTSAILLCGTSFIFANDHKNEEYKETKSQNIQYKVSYAFGTCTLYLWHTDALGNETHWTETYETSTQSECNQLLQHRLEQLDSLDPCGSGDCPPGN
ncbi:hypothetical protein [Chryseobacterium gossypii]|uniref:hypothetical protein n=1 Tax=Chryseobacterium gossypii TaxID=3231602 RepID=UPI003526401F